MLEQGGATSRGLCPVCGAATALASTHRQREETDFFGDGLQQDGAGNEDDTYAPSTHIFAFLFFKHFSQHWQRTWSFQEGGIGSPSTSLRSVRRGVGALKKGLRIAFFSGFSVQCLQRIPFSLFCFVFCAPTARRYIVPCGRRGGPTPSGCTYQTFPTISVRRSSCRLHLRHRKRWACSRRIPPWIPEAHHGVAIEPNLLSWNSRAADRA